MQVFNIISILIGASCFVVMAIGLIPFLGWVQWLVMAGTVLGIIFGAVSGKKAGLWINGAVLLVAIFRSLLGGGLI